MKKNRKILIIGIIAVIVCLATFLIKLAGRETYLEAKDIFTDTEKLVANLTDGENRSLEILEIVSNHDNARLGYLIGGQEPFRDKNLDFFQMEQLANRLEEEGILYKGESTSHAYPLSYVVDTVELPSDCTEEQREELLNSGYTLVNAEEFGDQSGTVSGNEEESGEGNPEQPEEGSEEENPEQPEEGSEEENPEQPEEGSEEGNLEQPAEGSEEGNLEQSGEGSQEENSSEQGTVSENESGTGSTSGDGNGSTGGAVNPTPEAYIFKKAIITNNEVFKKYVFGVEAGFERLNVNVTSLTLAEVQEADVEKADLIYVSGVLCNQYLEGADLDKIAATAIISKVTSGSAAIILDHNIYSMLSVLSSEDAYANGYLYKLCLIMASQNPSDSMGMFSGNSAFEEDVAGNETWEAVKQSKLYTVGEHFVNRNIYWYKHDVSDFVSPVCSTGPCFVNGDFTTLYTPSAVSRGFESVRIARDEENYNNEINNPDKESMNLDSFTPAVTVQYLLNYAGKADIIYKDKINVLEIQPCRDFRFNTPAGKSELIANWLGDFKDKQDNVTVTCMTVSEFIGHNEKVNEKYDLIYIGSNKGAFNVSTPAVRISSTGRNLDFNYRIAKDSKLSGILYSHVGDLANLSSNANDGKFGLLKTDYANSSGSSVTQYRNPGTDLTVHKYEELKDYLDSGNPIIVADDFFTYMNYRIYDSSDAKTSAPTGINGGSDTEVTKNNNVFYGIIDSSSYMYKLLVYAVTGQDTYINTEDWKANNKTTIEWKTQTSIGTSTTGKVNRGYWQLVSSSNTAGTAGTQTVWSARAKKNLFHESEVKNSAADFTRYINNQKLYLNLTSRPKEYTYTTSAPVEVSNMYAELRTRSGRSDKQRISYIVGNEYLQKNADGLYYLEYEFSISSLGNNIMGRTYDCELFIDNNNDGKFSKTTEKIDLLEITDLSTNTRVTQQSYTFNGATRNVYQLKTGVPYKLRRVLPDNYTGCICWNLACSANDNDNISVSEIGYTVVPQNSGKTKLKILQITSGSNVDGDNQIVKDGYNYTSSVDQNNLNLQKEMEAYRNNDKTVWGTLLSNIPDFELEITTKSTYGTNGLVKILKDLTKEVTKESDKLARIEEYLEQYDMLIFGFGDGYEEINYNLLLKAIEDYANKGKSILFAHDTTYVELSQMPGFYNYNKTSVNKNKNELDKTTDKNYYYEANNHPSYTGIFQETSKVASQNAHTKYLTSLVRYLGGSDTYGVTAYEKSFVEGHDSNGNPISAGTTIKVNYARSGEAIKKFSDNARTKTTAGWDYLVASGKDIAFAPNTFQEQTVPNTQGPSYAQCRENVWGTNRTVNFMYNLYSGTPFTSLHTTGPTNAAEYPKRTGNTTSPSAVSKINEGMITKYPYHIADSFNANNTHSQYWTLDLTSDSDRDGESDLVVWYTIDDITLVDNNYYSDDFNSISPRDVSNNYYIYNMGSITYTGVGHTRATSEEEVKLFINTMVASYMASVKNPGVKIVEDSSVNSSKIKNIVVPYWDGSNSATPIVTTIMPYIRIYFNVSDSNIVKGNKTMRASFSLAGTAIDNPKIYDTMDEAKYDEAPTSVNEVNELLSGHTYFIDLPSSLLNEDNAASQSKVDLEIQVHTDWIRNGSNFTSEAVSDTVAISKVELFDLD